MFKILMLLLVAPMIGLDTGELLGWVQGLFDSFLGKLLGAG